jgi:ADP-ribose pyrophosphatase YjhB (NUDIX family)
VEPGEDLASAVEREVREETGLEVRCGALLGWAERMGPGYHFVILDFTVTVPDHCPDPVARSDAAAVAWVPLEDVAAVLLVEGLEEFLRAHAVIA